MTAYLLGIVSAVIGYVVVVMVQDKYQDYLADRRREIVRIAQELVIEHERTYNHERQGR